VYQRKRRLGGLKRLIMTLWRKKNKDRDHRQKPIDALKERCDCIDDLIIKYKGYMLILRKARGKSSEPADIDLIDFRYRVDGKINNIIKMIDRRLRSITP